jgi:hypothetical protein
MFKCKECGSTEFQLVVHPDHQGMVDVHCNEFNEVVVTANNREFIADLMFMNQFAVCKDCGAIKNWEYFFPEHRLAM